MSKISKVNSWFSYVLLLLVLIGLATGVLEFGIFSLIGLILIIYTCIPQQTRRRLLRRE